MYMFVPAGGIVIAILVGLDLEEGKRSPLTKVMDESMQQLVQEVSHFSFFSTCALTLPPNSITSAILISVHEILLFYPVQSSVNQAR